MLMDSNSYFTLQLELPQLMFHKVSTPSDYDLSLLEYLETGIETAMLVDKKELLYYVDKVTRIHYLCIHSLVVTEIITLAYGADHPRFSRCFEIITYSWFIQGLT